MIRRRSMIVFDDPTRMYSNKICYVIHHTTNDQPNTFGMIVFLDLRPCINILKKKKNNNANE